MVQTNSRRPQFNVLPGFNASSYLIVLMVISLKMIDCAKTVDLYWNTTNSMFHNDHIIKVNDGNMPFEYDRVNIICPMYESGTFENDTEKYIIYKVSEVEYDRCQITNVNARIIAMCDKPQESLVYTLAFRQFSPLPNALVFLSGHDYFFISTSSTDNIHSRCGGYCSTNEMKVVFKVSSINEKYYDKHYRKMVYDQELSHSNNNRMLRPLNFVSIVSMIILFTFVITSMN